MEGGTGARASETLSEGEKAAKIAGFVAFFLAVLKALIGFFSGSVVLLADALDSVFDLVGSLTSWFGLKVAQKEPDEHFPYGYYKAENIATLVVSLLLIYGALELLLRGWSRLFELPSLTLPLAAMGIAFVSSVASYLLSKYLEKTGKKINSSLLIATSKERKKDVFSSIIVFIAITATYLNLPFVEGTVTILLSFLIMAMGVGLIKDSLFALMDVSPNKEIEEKTRKTVGSVPNVESFNDLLLRKSGPFIFGEVKIKVKSFINVQKAHEIASEIEEKVYTAVPQIEHFTVHVEPYEPEEHTIVIPVKTKGKNPEVTNHFGRAKYFLFVTTKKRKIQETKIEKNPFKTKKVRAGLKVANYLVEKKVTAITTKRIGEISFHTLKNNFIQVYKTKGKTSNQVIQNFLKRKLKVMEKPTHEKD